MLVESNGEKLYKLVSETDISNTISEYHKQRPIGLGNKPVNERPNPFKTGILEEKQNEAEPDHDSLQLLAYRQICLVPIQTVLALENATSLLPQVIDSVKKLILATPDVTIRHLAVQIIDMIMSN
ncbi:unnamed protein product [Nippostrongylus brasiliensis]|uniref:DUF3385 domain-containing protein n=1 Tax=Nippostrongylus brasiliensis TaxID=27835 RepID=A0A0N4XN87_NIPBR|nr:unnamed protein product [Nippostrongylus brasiliensis]